MIKITCPNCGEQITIGKDQYNTLINEVEKEELNKRVSEQVKQIEAKYKAEFALEESKLRSQQNDEINELKKNNALLEEKLKGSEKEKQFAMAKFAFEQREKMTSKDMEIEKLKTSLETAKKDADILASKQKEFYDTQLKLKDEEIEKYKNFRLGDSTKDLGESLEQYCHDSFDEIRAVAYPRAYFEKDNDVDEEGKGDFIFRDFAEDGTEIVSIMFEMKNQKDTTKTKHKNEHFFDKLDKNRTSKGCEYAVLVTTLEEDSKLYNSGIVDVSYRYPKMFVVRPQNFLAIIGLLRSMAINNLKYKQQVIAYQRENVDITNFEEAVKSVVEKITSDYDKANAIYSEVDNMCDTFITRIEKFRKDFRSAAGWIEKAKNQLPNLEVRKLTRNNQTMKAKFDTIKNN